jgi:hypothetical protein
MRRNPLLIGLFLLTTLPLACTTVQTTPATPNAPIALDRVPVEYGFGHRITDTFAMSPEDWAQIEAAFSPRAATAAQEREQIREAVALMEMRAGRTTPTREDRGRNATVPNSMGQMDCINESTNTTTYLRLFHQEGLMRRHAVLGRAYRSPVLLDAHYSAQILDFETGERYVVDSWFLANGFPPMIQPVAAWGRKDPALPASATVAVTP